MNTTHVYAFEKLNVWQDCRLFTRHIYSITSFFPDTEKFALANQMRRASISICSNIAEGCSRASNKDQAHFYQIAFSSLMEVLNQAIIANDLGYLSNSVLDEIRNETEKISRMLNALHKQRLS
jgi:four helix bundle protein